jgi:hypothetical protein
MRMLIFVDFFVVVVVVVVLFVFRVQQIVICEQIILENVSTSVLMPIAVRFSA